MTSLEKWAPYALSILRIVAALLFIEHGLQKFFGFPSAGPPMSAVLWMQAGIEVFGGIALLVVSVMRWPPYGMPLGSVKCPPVIWWTPDDDGSGIKRGWARR
jgi:DoxX